MKRKSQWVNKMREIGVYSNGEKIGTIDDGETKEFEIEPGLHCLNVKLDWGRSPVIEIEISKNNVQYIELSGFKNSQWLLPCLIIFSAISFILGYLNIDTDFITWAIIFPLLLYFFYFVTIGRKRYLELKIR